MRSVSAGAKNLMCAIILIAALFLPIMLTACNSSSLEKIVSLVDNIEGYNDVALTDSQKNINSDCTIKNLFANDNKRVFYSVAKNGYNGSLGIAVLLEHNKIKKIAPVDMDENENHGTMCFSDSYLNNFVGIDVTEKVELVGGVMPDTGVDITYLSGATRTSSALIAAVNAVIAFVNLHQDISVTFG
ncbi:MAG: FMN-binding protein [Clostridia bacterium]